MAKLVESTFITLDGVISDPQNWGPPYWDDEHNAYAAKVLEPAGSLLLGRETYEGFAQAWPGQEGDYADKINALPKHVASRTLTEATWNATVIEGDLAEGVTALKASETADIVKFGTGATDLTLVGEGLVDELHLWIFPVVYGQGERLLDGIDLTHLELLDITRFKSGIAVNVYGPK